MLNPHGTLYTYEIMYNYNTEQLRKDLELKRLIEKAYVKKIGKKNPEVIKHVIEGVGRALISSGNKLLDIA